jgi:hypothetical protein
MALVRALVSAAGPNFVFDEDQIYEMSDYWAERYIQEGMVERFEPEAATLAGLERATNNPTPRVRTTSPRTPRKSKGN